MENNRIQTIRGENYSACVETLRDRYGNGGYQITGRGEVYREGVFSRLIGKKEMEVQYVVTPQKPASFEDERQKILNIAGGRPAVPLAALTKILDEQGRTLEEIRKKISSGEDLHPSITKIEEILEENEFTPPFIEKIAKKMKTLSLEELEDEALVHKTVAGWIGQEIKVSRPPAYTKPPRVVVLVGPTGVGKTTTIAKLAARYRINQDSANGYEPFVRLVTLDCFKIGGYEQIEKYADILAFKASKIESSEDIARIISMDEGRLDALLIDTIGYSHNDFEGIAKMCAVLNLPSLNAETYLTVSASTKARDVQNILRNYEPFNYKSVIVTKLDETEHIGNIVSVLSEKNKPVAFVTTGQKISQHLEDASPATLLRKLTDFTIDREYFSD